MRLRAARSDAAEKLAIDRAFHVIMVSYTIVTRRQFFYANQDTE